MTTRPADIVQQLELDLLEPATRNDRTTLERLLADDFVEIGSAGERLERDAVIAGLLAEQAGSDGHTILRCRSSVWRRKAGH